MIPEPMHDQLSLCPLRRRLDRLLTIAAQVNERLTLWHGRDGSHVAQVTVVTDGEGPMTGQGADVCEALDALESQLDINLLERCRACGQRPGV